MAQVYISFSFPVGEPRGLNPTGVLSLCQLAGLLFRLTVLLSERTMCKNASARNPPGTKAPAERATGKTLAADVFRAPTRRHIAWPEGGATHIFARGLPADLSAVCFLLIDADVDRLLGKPLAYCLSAHD